ncbi:hypothetical protein Acsp05_45250 [Actinokineospora sp. NBRC 105648]|nr:hypothetical protein Acsp05_45250 [Actinokineospora sp. NBRC 105648]
MARAGVRRRLGAVLKVSGWEVIGAASPGCVVAETTTTGGNTELRDGEPVWSDPVAAEKQEESARHGKSVSTSPGPRGIIGPHRGPGPLLGRSE